MCQRKHAKGTKRRWVLGVGRSSLKPAVSVELERKLVERAQADEFIAAKFANIDDDIVIVVTSALRR